MRIAVVSNTDSFIPFVYTLAAQQLQVHIFFSPPKDPFVQQKVRAFVTQQRLSLTEEKNPDKDLYQWLQKGNYDICFVLGYPHLIKLDRLKGCITQLFNIHFGPLPEFRGPVPVFWQLKKGVEKVGLTIHKLSSKFDDGPVVWMKQVANLPHYNYEAVNQLLSQVCIEGVIFILRLAMHHLPIAEITINKANAAYQKRPVLNDILINWQEMTAEEICNLVRAGNPWNKGAITFFKTQEMKLMDAIVVNNLQGYPADTKAGTIIQIEKELLICCKNSTAINVNMLFYNDCYIPSYQCKHWGFAVGQSLG